LRSVTTLSSFDLGVLFQEFPVWIHFEPRLFSIRSDDDFFHLPLESSSLLTWTTSPPAAFWLIVSWTEAGSDFSSTTSPGWFFNCAVALHARAMPIIAASGVRVVFTFVFS